MDDTERKDNKGLSSNLKPKEAIGDIVYKSHFARKLSNRFYSPSLLSSVLKTQVEVAENQTFAMESSSDLPPSSATTVSCPPLLPPENTTPIMNSYNDMKTTEISALKIEIETLQWQLHQTETNRQMLTSLLEQVVLFLNNIIEKVETQDEEPKIVSTKKSNTNLARSKSVFQVNKNMEISPARYIRFNKMSKSIGNFNNSTLLESSDTSDSCQSWKQSKKNLAPSTDSKKLIEEISRFVTLAKTVLQTPLPSFATSPDKPKCDDSLLRKTQVNHIQPDSQKDLNSSQDSVTLPEINDKQDSIVQKDADLQELQEIFPEEPCVEENSDGEITKTPENKEILNEKNIKFKKYRIPFNLNTSFDSSDGSDYFATQNIDSPQITRFAMDSPLTCGLEDTFAALKFETPKKVKAKKDEKKDLHAENESGFSSLSSFQELGIPILNSLSSSPPKPPVSTSPETLKDMSRVYFV